MALTLSGLAGLAAAATPAELRQLERDLPLLSPGLFAVRASRGRWQMARHLALLDQTLTDVGEGRCRRVIVEMPPRHGKSELIGRYFPPWLEGRWPDKRVIYTSYEARQARRYGRSARNVFTMWAPKLFNLSLSPDAAAADNWGVRGHEGGMETTGVGGPLTGKGAHVLIVDDPIKNAAEAASEVRRNAIWEWWLSTAFPRLEPAGAAIIVQTRWHKDDLAGRVQREQPSENWRVISLPALAEDDDAMGRQHGEALWPERFPQHELQQIRDSQSLYWWLALYQQRPTKHASVEWPSGYFDGEDLWFRDWPRDMLRVIALDPSKGKTKHSDYSAYVLLGETPDGRLWVEGNLERRPVGQLVEDGAELCRSFRPLGLGLEINAWQDLLSEPLTQAFNQAGLVEVAIHGIDNRVNKENRIRRLDPCLRGRRFRFRDTPGTRLLVNQLREFPMAEHDDGPDALEMAMRLLHHYKSGEVL